ncbi:hypothetical protein C8D97_10538 [Pleionea mediterranea]|uniref:Uncharacterized protein n=1 Tax=Pleionea mediterranea TaxID=523701 RepID=A0A316FTN2_9GAMM|nr:hypothetical protein C8D97_10538 [Pleionea mediterranea]
MNRLLIAGFGYYQPIANANTPVHTNLFLHIYTQLLNGWFFPSYYMGDQRDNK